MADTYTVIRTTVIDAPADAVYAQIVDFHRWPSWSPWEDLDPDLERTYTGAESGVGAVYTWRGNRKAGEGRMEVIETIEPSKVVIALQFLKPFKSTSTSTFELQPDGEATRVAWTMTGPKTLLTKIMGIVKSMDAMIGPDFEKGLARLESTVEGRPTGDGSA